MPPRKRPDGAAYLVTGMPGSGKSAWTFQRVGRPPRLLVWDSMEEWSANLKLARVRSIRELHELVRADLQVPGPFQVGYVGPITSEHFELFCKLAWIWLRHQQGVLVVEELSDVTSPGKAPPAWGEIGRKHRHVGAEVYALSQRPAESDKTIVGNAAIIHCGPMAFADDRKYMARCLDVDVERVTALERLHYIERDMRTRALRSGVVSFGNTRRASHSKAARKR